MSAEIRETLRFLQQENARLKEENRALREEARTLKGVVDALRSLQMLSEHISATSDIVALLGKILSSALAVIDAADGSLLLIDDDTGELVFAVVHGSARDRLTGYRIPTGTGIAGWAVEHRAPVIVPDVRQDSRFSPRVDETFGFKTRSLLCVPILTSAKVLGVFTAVNKFDGHEFTEADLALLGIVAQLAATAMERADQAA
ncbi:MAG: GAF domain-containing protein [Chloroflexi bacterium]|nr:GAF domain-containing protein [Chloroflexota bacterium]MBI3763107.1 GAF domain-containing protein [Chloroflexota bacterium]